MIVGFIVTCDSCNETEHVLMERMNYTIDGDALEVLDRWVCDKCIAKEQGAVNAENIA